jgi:hypothetical protein
MLRCRSTCLSAKADLALTHKAHLHAMSSWSYTSCSLPPPVLPEAVDMLSVLVLLAAVLLLPRPVSLSSRVGPVVVGLPGL